MAKTQKPVKPIPKINLLLGQLVKKHGTKKKVALSLGITGAGLGNYINKGRDIPVSLIEKWQEIYGNNLIEEAKTFDGNGVSRETEINNVKHILTQGDYISLHKMAWDEFKKTLVHSRKVLTSIAKSNSTLTNSNSELVSSIAELVRGLPKNAQR